MNCRQSQHRWVLAERHRAIPAFGVLVDHLRADFGVEQPRQLAGNDPIGVGAGPRLDVPVVPCPDRRHRKVAVLGDLLQSLAGKTWKERGEIQRRVHTVEVHVLDTLVDIPCAAAHFVEPGRLEAVLGHRSSDDRVEANVGQRLPVVHPGLTAVIRVDDPRRAVGELPRNAAFEGVRRLHDVVVDGDDGVEPLGAFGFGQEGDGSFRHRSWRS